METFHKLKALLLHRIHIPILLVAVVLGAGIVLTGSNAYLYLQLKDAIYKQTRLAEMVQDYSRQLLEKSSYNDYLREQIYALSPTPTSQPTPPPKVFTDPTDRISFSYFGSPPQAEPSFLSNNKELGFSGWSFDGLVDFFIQTLPHPKAYKNSLDIPYETTYRTGSNTWAVYMEYTEQGPIGLYQITQNDVRYELVDYDACGALHPCDDLEQMLSSFRFLK